jgi:hypothetical protein
MILSELYEIDDEAGLEHEEIWVPVSGMWKSTRKLRESAHAFRERQRSERATARRAARLLKKRGLIECRMQFIVDGDEYEDDDQFGDPGEPIQLAARITPAGRSYARAQPSPRSAASTDAVPIAPPRRARRAARRGPAAF